MFVLGDSPQGNIESQTFSLWVFVTIIIVSFQIEIHEASIWIISQYTYSLVASRAYLHPPEIKI